jgi:cytochrome P450
MKGSVNPFDRGLSDRSIFDDPYPIYQVLRETAPICWSNLQQTWVIARHQDIVDGLKSGKVTAKDEASRQIYSPWNSVNQQKFFYGWLMYQKPLIIPQIKKVAQLLFSQGNVSRILVTVTREAQGILSDHQQLGSLDVVKQYGGPLALRAVCELLCVRIKIICESPPGLAMSSILCKDGT